MDEAFEPADDFGPDTPEVMFLPLGKRLGEWGTVDAGLFARRIPDFVRLLINEGQQGPAAMLEMQTMADNGPVTWVDLDHAPDREDAFAMVPADLGVRAIVAGMLEPQDGALRVEFAVYRDEDDDDAVTTTFAGVVAIDDPVPGLQKLARHLARHLELPWREPPTGLLTRNGAAFALFLRGLDGEKLISGALDITTPDDKEALVQPFVDALELDPGFGLALRLLSATATQAMHGARLDGDVVRRLLDRCYEANPGDGEGCVEVAAQLTEMGEDLRAMAWLQRAVTLDPPSPRGLEHLGLLLARRGERDGARDLWQKGLDVDGHPDFFSHLAQLSFAEDRDADAWDFTLHGLRRLRERTLRADEWDDPSRGGGVLLECLHAQLGRHDAPPSLAAALRDLRGLLEGEDRVTLGLCLLAVGERAMARAEIVAGLRRVEELEVRDQGVRALLQLDVADFEGRFARACDRATHGRKPAAALAELQMWAHLQPEFWPAHYHAALALGRMRRSDEALDLLLRALAIAPGQPDVLLAMAEAFDRRRNPKRAIELVEEAMKREPRDARLLGARIRYLRHLGRDAEARDGLKVAHDLGVDSEELRRLARRLRRR